jgi:predicted CxxxxCH...CXXCH cytochrome family protein
VGGDPACLACHDTGQVSPLCTDCHAAVANPAAIAEGTCVSCHGDPPDGTARPNREGAHSEHVPLTPSTGGCSACHAGAGSAALTHFDNQAPADVNIASVFDGKRGVATRSQDGTCSNVSCHGGQTTPVWTTGALVVAQDCQACHEQGTAAGIPEANSYYSGRHGFHVGLFGGLDPPCIGCHDAGQLAAGGHFANLETPEFEGIPSSTLRGELSYVAPTCTVSSADPLFAPCHQGQTRTW